MDEWMIFDKLLIEMNRRDRWYQSLQSGADSPPAIKAWSAVDTSETADIYSPGLWGIKTEMQRNSSSPVENWEGRRG